MKKGDLVEIEGKDYTIVRIKSTYITVRKAGFRGWVASLLDRLADWIGGK